MEAPLRTLIVEDVPNDAELVIGQLHRDGRTLDWSRVDNEAAFRAALNPDLDVILSDCNLPSFSASRALEILRESRIDVPLIIVSGTIGEEAATELMRNGAADYVSKDRTSRLSMAISRAMAEAKSRRDRQQDLDNLRQAKAQLEEAINQLKLTQDSVIAEERLHALGQMSAGIAHDFNNYLSPIIGLSELMLTRPHIIGQPEKVLQYLRAIHQAGLDAALVVRRLREYYRAANAGDEVEVIDLKLVVEQTIELTQSRWGDQSLSTDTKYRITTKLDEAGVAGRASELRQMLVNLIFNALDAMPNGGDLSFTIERDAKRPGIVNLEVRDTGEGMTAEVRKRCLEPFFTTKGTAGTGLGLATTYGIVKRHHGEIQIESEPGIGTRIIITLPTVAMQRTASAPKEKACTPTMHILVIDDEVMVSNVIAEYLRADGHRVDVADGPTIGLHKINDGQYDLIITDRAMPEMSGDQLAIRAKRIAPHVPILMLTGFGDFMIARGERPVGVDAVIGKPVSIDGLRDAIADVTSRPLPVP
jgi:Signal transduction histidine kinase regulating C4-dicarboxylate transport system